eukprot:CAMPEP_0117523630 /NCGR_PEP_ID=MMETSP0784-20121206/34827_1 /TAXON_ID=39447 /ORGANISM="" /LENGTH=416 /DNA_ID=CAMNT_0005319749 /DNA_START=23 /DNA_END=1273 /DNA_ORIENTATION=+
MADDLTKGLNLLLHPKFTELDKRITRLEQYSKELTNSVSLKEERSEVDHLREHMRSQIAQVGNVLEFVKQKFANLDEVRTKELRGLAKAVEQKAPITNLNHVSEQVQSLTVAMSTRVENAKVDRLAKQLQSLSEDVALKATGERVEGIEGQLQSLKALVNSKASHERMEVFNDRMKLFATSASLSVTNQRLDDLNKELQALSENNANKVDNHQAHEILLSVQSLNDAVAQRAECTKVDHLLRQYQMVHDELHSKAGLADAQQTARHLNALSDAVARKSDLAKHYLLSEQFDGLRDDVLVLKNQLAKVDDLTSLVESLNAALELESAKVRRLTVLAADAPPHSARPAAHSTGSTASPPPQTTNRTLNPCVGGPGTGECNDSASPGKTSILPQVPPNGRNPTTSRLAVEHRPNLAKGY